MTARPCTHVPARPRCDGAGEHGGFTLCQLARSLAATMRAARAFDAIEAGSATLVDGHAVDNALVGIQEMLDGQRLPRLAGVGVGPQRAARN